MNFKFTKGKVAGSIAILIVIWAIMLAIGSSSTLLEAPGIIANFLTIHNLENALGLGNIVLIIIEIAIVFVIWSLFQKKSSQKK